MESQSEARIPRALERLDGMINKLNFLFTYTFLQSRPLQEFPIDDELHIAFCRHKGHLLDNCPFNDVIASPGASGAFFTHNGCTNTLRAFAPLIAFVNAALSEPLNFQEAHLYGVQAVVPIVLHDIDGGDPIKVAAIHSMFRAAESAQKTATGFFLDATAPQFGRPAGLREASTYPVDLGHPDSHNNRSEALGTQYSLHLQELHGTFTPGTTQRDGITILRMEILLRTINNNVFASLKTFGGARIISSADDELWSVAEKMIIAEVRRGLQTVQEKLNGIYAAAGDKKRKAVARDIAGNELGEGHRIFVKALEESLCRSLVGGLEL